MIELIMWLDCAYDETSLEVKCLARRIEFNNQPAMKRQLDIDELDALGEFGGRWRNDGSTFRLGIFGRFRLEYYLDLLETKSSYRRPHATNHSNPFVPSRMYNEGSATR